ncbi:class I SAM-dependent methyltransferase [Marinobacter sp. NFXS9]|uniref:SAM-dependent methyltransferase n=1 Tax=Marinobacter sp. NFXS9 TaxID=2818433 RepID=UPI0032DE741E
MTMKPGDPHYRAYVGDPVNYDLIAATVFNLMTTLGLRDHHKVLDVGCGSLRNARLLIPYLARSGYVGIEPNRWLVEEGMSQECGKDVIELKQARFSFRTDCTELNTDERFDFILLQSIFSHCGEDLVRHWLQELDPHLADDGVMLVTWFPDQKNSGESGWLYPGLVRYNEAYFKSMVEEAGLTYKSLNWPHPIQRWAMLTRSQARLDWVDETGLSFYKAFQRMRKPRPGH